MALEPQKFHGTARNGRVELEPGAKIPDGAEVVVLFQPDAAVKPRQAALNRLLAAMNKGYALGGGPYPKRGELYGDTGRPSA